MRNALTQQVLTIPREELSRDLYRTVEVDPEADPRYEAFVGAHPEAIIYHHPAWLQVLARENGDRPLCLATEDEEGRLTGVLALFETRGVPFAGGQLTGPRLSSLPRTPTAGPLVSDPAASAALLRAAAEYVDRKRGVRLQIKTSSDELDPAVEGLVGSRWRPFYVLELPKRSQDLRFGNARNHARIRSTVNKAEKMNIRVREANSEHDLRAWYDIYLETMRWHAIPPRSYRFFKAAWDALQPRGLLRLLVAELCEPAKSHLLAGSVFLMFGRTCFYAFNGCRRRALSLQPNDVIQWHAIHDACNDGFRYYDLGEVCANHEGLAFFKKKWGGEEKWLYRYYYPTPDRFQSGAIENQNHPAVKAIWRRLPLKATMLLGDRIYAYL